MLWRISDFSRQLENCRIAFGSGAICPNFVFGLRREGFVIGGKAARSAVVLSQNANSYSSSCEFSSPNSLGL
jgi:hypothetical protein